MSTNKTWVNNSLSGSPADHADRAWRQDLQTLPIIGTFDQTKAGITIVNAYDLSGQTLVNTDRQDQLCANQTTGPVIDLKHGFSLLTCGGAFLTIQKRIGKADDNGESDVFLCHTNEHAERIIKVFRRAVPEKTAEKKVHAHQALKSEYIVPLLDHGFYAGHYFEVYPYYACGSLSNDLNSRTFSYDQLEEVIIPQLNRALKELHDAGIYHRDLKPSNILWRDSARKNIVLIDIGLLSIIRDPSSQTTALISETGGTRAYEPPELHDGLYMKESDYFSMGIILYELFCGEVPKGVYSNRITRPENMPPKLHDLILGLTYVDISNRKDKRNPNRRWTYDEVIKWLKGDNQPVPGTVQTIENKTDPSDEKSIPPFSFKEKVYSNIDALCAAMTADWEGGRACIMRGSLLQHLKHQTKTVTQALWISQIEDITNSSYTPDQKLLRVIMALAPDHPYIACPLGRFSSLDALGKRLAACMQSNSETMRKTAVDAMKTLLSTNELSTFAGKTGTPKTLLDQIKHFETLPTNDRWERQKESLVFELAYRLSGEKKLDIGLPDGTIFDSAQQLMHYLSRFDTRDFKELYRICGDRFLDSAHQIKPNVYGWLRSQGYELDGFNQ